MTNRTWKVAGVLGSVLALTAGTGTLVRADETSTEITNDNSAESVLETAVWENKAAANVNSYANVRLEASEEAERSGVLPKGAAAEVVTQEGDWTKVVSGEVEGYVKTELLAFADEARNLYEGTYGSQGTVTASSLRIRNAPSLEGEQIGSRPEGSKVALVGQEGDWYQIDQGDGSPAYMFAEYIQIDETTAITIEAYQQLEAEAQAEEERKATEAAAVQAEQVQEPAGEQQASVEVSQMSASGGELDLLAAIIQCEAGGESHTGKVAVGAVIMNRVNSGQFPNSISEVVYQSGQFSPVASGKLSSVLGQGARSDCYDAAREALNGSNPVGGALYFNSGSGKGQQIGNQHFY